MVYLVMEKLTGGDLFDSISQRGRYTEADAASVVQQVASALAGLHSIGVVLCDLKPALRILFS